MPLRQHDAVIEAMRANGGYATLGHLYRRALQIPGVEWKTKTPFASIRRIVQTRPEFFKIEPGLWALEEFRGRVPFVELMRSEPKKQEEFSHSYFQGLIVEVGNLEGFTTYVPSQDKNKTFVNKPLHEVATTTQILPFTYEVITNQAKMVDVIWFNKRHLPSAFFEVEHSTDIYNSLRKFSELQDFHSIFRIVAPAAREREFQSKLSSQLYKTIAKRVEFWSYDTVSQLHTSTYQAAVAKELLTWNRS